MKKGFTLLELLIVIGILAILASVTVLVLNPAELLRQARDTQRMSDLKAINSALALYASTAATVSLGTTGNVYSHNGGTNASTTGAFGAAPCVGDITGHTTSTARTVLGSGWIPVDFGDISGGTPLSVLPVDPSSGVGTISTIDSWQLVYNYSPDTTNTTWELAAKMESTRYRRSGANDVESTDGGTCNDWYEIGTDSALDL